jgi:hypothetical protein
LPAGADICSSVTAPALLYYRPFMALCNAAFTTSMWLMEVRGVSFCVLMAAYSIVGVNEFNGLSVVLYLYGNSRRIVRLNFD